MCSKTYELIYTLNQKNITIRITQNKKIKKRKKKIKLHI